MKNQYHYSDQQLYTAAKERVAQIFGITSDQLNVEWKFEKDIKPSRKGLLGFFKNNEMDIIRYDIEDAGDFYGMSEEDIQKELRTGVFEVKTIGDYCEFMVCCYRFNPEEVVYILFEKQSYHR